MAELEPCPFCGGDVKLIRDQEMEHYVIECKNHAWGDPNETPDMAAGDVSMVSWRDTEESKHALIETWNARWERTCRNLRRGSDFKCSECGCEVTGSDYFMEANISNGDWNYCPNCQRKVAE